MQAYGSDKPDLRYSLRWEVIQDWPAQSQVPFLIGKKLHWLWIAGAKAPRRFQERWQEIARSYQAFLAIIQKNPQGIQSSLNKFFANEEVWLDFGMKTDGVGFLVGLERENYAVLGLCGVLLSGI